MASSIPNAISGEVLFTVRNNTPIFSNDNSNNENYVHEEVETEQSEVESGVVLSTIWKGSKLGAAYYNINEHQLYVLNDTTDFSPQYAATRALHCETNPSYMITFGTTCDEYVKFVIDLIECNDDTTVTSNEARTLPQELSLLNLKNYSYETCANAVSQLISSLTNTVQTETENQIQLHSFIDFGCKLSVHALGALVKFLEKNWGNFSRDGEALSFWQITLTTLKENVLIDQNTIKALQIFQLRPHESGFKHGLMSSSREGVSVFKLFSQYCCSNIGKFCLKNLLLKPIKSINELNKRMDFIEFAMSPINQSFIENLVDNIKKVVDVNGIISKVQHLRGNIRDWECLFKTIHHMTVIYELCEAYANKSLLVFEYGSLITQELYSLMHSIKNAIEFDSKCRSSRPRIKFGLDNELDAKKLRHKDITKQITAAGKFAIHRLPDYLNECTMVYIPEMGHLITFKEWTTNCDYNELQQYGFQFIFKMHRVLHFKNPLCLELDRQLGDVYADIVAHESRILNRLSGFVVKFNKQIREPLYFVSLLDSLIAMSKVAKMNNYVRPNLNTSNVHEIEESRHPLLEFVSSSFEPNNFYSGGEYSFMKIITGPNGSGKSVYLKQIALLIYMAHIGSYLPAKSANISMVHSIHSRIHSTESAAIRLSSFMIDFCQMAQALYNATSTSIILVDEFGRGTTGEEGIAMLAGALMKFLTLNENCPHILVSTHFQEVTNLIPRSRFVDHLHMDYRFDQTNGLLFLFKVVEGVSYSFATKVAAAVGVKRDIIERAQEILHRMKNNQPVMALPEIANLQRPLEHTNNPQIFENLTIPEPQD